MTQLYKIRCRIHGITITTKLHNHNIVWKRIFNPEIFSQDKYFSNKSNLINKFMKPTNAFKETIEQHLHEVASKDALFAETLKKENKNIDDCITYILNRVQKSGCNGFADSEIFNMAIHYYDEDDLKPGKKIAANVVVNHTVEISEEEKVQAKKAALDNLIEEEKAKLTKKKTPKKDLQKEVEQVDLFS